jgi:hypothetical protein
VSKSSDLSSSTHIKNCNSSQCELREIQYYETCRAWALLENEGITDYEPEYLKLSELQFDSVLNDSESVLSLPDHNIPYISGYTVIFYLIN